MNILSKLFFSIVLGIFCSSSIPYFQDQSEAACMGTYRQSEPGMRTSTQSEPDMITSLQSEPGGMRVSPQSEPDMITSPQSEPGGL